MEGLYKFVLAFGTVIHLADAALNRNARVGMNEEFHSMVEMRFEKGGEVILNFVGLLDIDIIRYRKMGIDMEEAGIVDNTHIVNINPIGVAMGVKQLYYFIDDSIVGFVHNARYRFADNFNARNDNDDGKEKGGNTIEPSQFSN